MPTYDVVCGKSIDEEHAEMTDQVVVERRTTFHFCSFKCKLAFVANPHVYIYPFTGVVTGTTRATKTRRMPEPVHFAAAARVNSHSAQDSIDSPQPVNDLSSDA